MRYKTGILIARRFLRAMTATVLAIIIAACTVSAKPTLHEIFTDNAVLPAMKAGGTFTLSVTNTAGDGAQILFSCRR